MNEPQVPVSLAAKLKQQVNFPFLEEWARLRIEKHKDALTTNQDEIATALLRGQIEGLREVLKLSTQVEQTLRNATKAIDT